MPAAQATEIIEAMTIQAAQEVLRHALDAEPSARMARVLRSSPRARQILSKTYKKSLRMISSLGRARSAFSCASKTAEAFTAPDVFLSERMMLCVTPASRFLNANKQNRVAGAAPMDPSVTLDLIEKAKSQFGQRPDAEAES